jgi:hypothetical protein
MLLASLALMVHQVAEAALLLALVALDFMQVEMAIMEVAPIRYTLQAAAEAKLPQAVMVLIQMVAMVAQDML